MPPTRSRQRDPASSSRLRRQTTTMYGRPAGSASSLSLRAFDNSIIPIRFARSIFERRAVFLADPPVFRRDSSKRENFWRPRRLSHRDYIFAVVKGEAHMRRTPAWPFRIRFRFSARFHARPPKVERLGMTGGGHPSPFNRRVPRAVKTDFAGVRNAPRN